MSIIWLSQNLFLSPAARSQAFSGNFLDVYHLASTANSDDVSHQFPLQLIPVSVVVHPIQDADPDTPHKITGYRES